MLHLPTSTIRDWSSIMSTSSDLDTNALIFSLTKTASGNLRLNSATLSIHLTDLPSSESNSKNLWSKKIENKYALSKVKQFLNSPIKREKIFNRFFERFLTDFLKYFLKYFWQFFWTDFSTILGVIRFANTSKRVICQKG